MANPNPLEVLIGRASAHLDEIEKSGASRPAGSDYQAATVMLLAQIALELQGVQRLMRARGETTQ